MLRSFQNQFSPLPKHLDLPAKAVFLVVGFLSWSRTSYPRGLSWFSQTSLTRRTSALELLHWVMRAIQHQVNLLLPNLVLHFPSSPRRLHLEPPHVSHFPPRLRHLCQKQASV